MRNLFNVFIAALLLHLGACSPKTPKAKAAVGINGDSVHNVPMWNWDAYPAVRKMKLGTLPCTLHPRSQITINSTLAGALKLYVTQPQTNLESGVIWGEFEPKIFEVESNAIAEARIKLDERERLLMELEIPKQRLTLERQLEEMQRQVAMVRMLTTNREFADLTLRAGDNTSVLRPDALMKAETELHLLNQSMTYLKETNMAALGIDLPGMRSQWEQRRVEYERRRSQATLKMPFAGQLTVSLPLAEGVAEYPVNIGQELGVARDLSVVRLRVPLVNSAWNALPPERLVAIIRLPSGGQLEAQFAYQKIERNQNREESAYYFQFLPEHTTSVARLIGTDVTCELWAELGQLTRIVPKLALVMHNQAAFQSGNWSAGLEAAFPGARLAIEGQTELGIVLPNKEFKQASR
jgi:hypothetical protein